MGNFQNLPLSMKGLQVVGTTFKVGECRVCAGASRCCSAAHRSCVSLLCRQSERESDWWSAGCEGMQFAGLVWASTHHSKAPSALLKHQELT